MALFVLVGWQLLMLASIVAAALGIWRKGVLAIGSSIALVAGATLSYGLVSAATGLGEGAWSFASPGFLAASAVGILGLVSVTIGSLALWRGST
jgi:hypothetical protein